MSYRGTTASYVSSTKYAAISVWATGVAKNVADMVRQTAPSINNERIFICIVAGTTQATEPTWNISQGVKTAESSGPTWMECTGQPAVNGDLTNTPNWTTVRNNNVPLGQIIKDNAGTHLFICTTASGSTNNTAEPTWNVSAVGNTTTDNSVTWTYIGTGFTNWKAPHARMSNAGSLANQTDINQFFIASDHAETQSTSSLNMQSGVSTQVAGSPGANAAGPVIIVGVDVAGSVPPVAADLSTSRAAKATTTSSQGITLSFGYVRWCYGITFSAGTSSGISLDIGGSGAGDKFYENCAFVLGAGTSSGGTFRINGGEGQGKIRIKDCTFKFAHIGQFIAPAAQSIIENCVFDVSVAVPTNLFQGVDSGAYTRVIGCDLSGLASTNFVSTSSGGDGFTIDFVDCKLPSSFTPAALFNSITSLRVNFTRCDNGSHTYNNMAVDRSGVLTTTAAIVRTGGAGDGTTPIAWRIDTTAFSQIPSQPFDAPIIANDSAVTGSTVNVTLYGVINSASLPTNDDICATVQYLGTSGNPQASFKHNQRTNFLLNTATTSMTADSTSAWDSAATARANSHAYVVGDIIAASSNSGRIFFCTGAGTSASSLPGGYATAVDGGSVTDGTATFRAGMRFSFTIALSSPAPALVGPVYTTVSFGKPSTTFFLDPAAVLS